MKADTKGFIYSIAATDASVHDSHVMGDPLHGDEEVIWGYRAYADASKRSEFEDARDSWRAHRESAKKKKQN